MKKATLTELVNHFISKYPSKEDFKIDLDRTIKDFEKDKCNPNQVAFYKRLRNKYIKMFF